VPEELGLLLLILLAIGWALFVLFGASVKVVGEFGTNVQESVALWRKRRFEKRKSNLARYVRIAIPNQLDRAERKIGQLESTFQQRQREADWIARKPTWEKKQFLQIGGDVSAVRDLCAVVRKEGASRGILVTTSTYGADAYAFANNEPVTLLNGAELLGLLRKHGYSFRISLEEARRLKPS
jgi:hypothetical protein